MSTAHNGNDYERLKQELRRLKRRGAPWYFESALHQRLHGGGRRRPRLRPISTTPVLVVAFVTLCLLGLAVYAVMVRTNLFVPGPHPAVTAPADTLSRHLTVDSVLIPPPRSTPAVRGSLPAEVRPPGAGPGRRDTSMMIRGGGRVLPGDTGSVRRDTAVPGRDTSSPGIDTAASSGREREGG